MGRPTESYLHSLASSSHTPESRSLRSSSPCHPPSSSSPSPKKARLSTNVLTRGSPPSQDWIDERPLSPEEWAVHPLNRNRLLRASPERRRPAGPRQGGGGDADESSPSMRELVDRFGVLSDEIIGLEGQEGLSVGLRRSLATLERVLQEGLIRFGDDDGGLREQGETSRGTTVRIREREAARASSDGAEEEPLLGSTLNISPRVNIPPRSRPDTVRY